MEDWNEFYKWLESKGYGIYRKSNIFRGDKFITDFDHIEDADSCETLKKKEIPTFEEWLEDNNYKYASNEYIRYGIKYFYSDLKIKYIIEINSL